MKRSSRIVLLATFLALATNQSSLAFVSHTRFRRLTICPREQHTTVALGALKLEKSSIDEFTLRLEYEKWREKYKKGAFDADRYVNFMSNYVTLMGVNAAKSKNAEKLNRPAPKPIELNEYADCSYDEYRAKSKSQSNRAPSTRTSKSDRSSIDETFFTDSSTSKRSLRSRSLQSDKGVPFSFQQKSGTEAASAATPKVKSMQSVKGVPFSFQQKSVTESVAAGNPYAREKNYYYPDEYSPNGSLQQADLLRNVRFKNIEKRYDEKSDIGVAFNTPTKEISVNVRWEIILKFLAYFQTVAVGAIVGPLAVMPFLAFHYLEFQDWTYVTYAQWTWDVIAAILQGSLFATTYRYTTKLDEDKNVKFIVLLAFIVAKSLVRVQVTPECAAGYDGFPLYCAEPFYIADESMMANLAMNTIESVALFGAISKSMDYFLERGSIRKYSD